MAFPVTIANSYGTTTIKTKPTRVVTLGWGSQDAAIALGVVPVGMPRGTYGDVDGTYPWITAALQGKPAPELIDGTQIPFEKIVKLKPDVILAVQSGLTRSEYTTLSKIAPTVSYPGKPWQTPWRQQALVVGKALGLETKAKQLVASVDTKIAAAAKAHPEFAGKTFAYGGYTGDGNYSFYTAADARVQLVTDLGFTVAPGVTTLAGDTSSFYFEVSLEKVPQVASQVWISSYDSESVHKQALANKVYATVPAVASGAEVALIDKTFIMATSAPSVLSVPWSLGTFVPMLAKAVGATIG